MSLAWVGQEDFAAGILRASARDSEPGVGVVTARNALFDDDGDIYRRGGDGYLSPLSGTGAITFIWSGYLNDQPKTLVTTATHAYSMAPGGVLTQIGTIGLARPVLPAVVGGKLWLPNGTSWDGGAALTTWGVHQHVAVCADRLIYADGSRISFSHAGDPTLFDPTDFHMLPDGVSVVGMVSIRDSLLAFTNYGVWSISNMNFDLTDELGNVQQTLSRIVPELSLLHEAGLCEWAGKIVAPCVDRVFLVDTISAPIAVSDSISPLYMTHVRSGHKPGGAKVFRNHLFLPWLTAAGVVSDLLVCRLNRPVRGRFIYYPWSTFDGHGGNVSALDVSLIGAAPVLQGANRDGRVSNLTNIFNPSDATPSDADGVAHSFELQTRDFPTGSGQPNHVRRLRLYYTLEGAGEVQAGALQAAYSVGSLSQTYGALRDSVDDYQQVDDDYINYDEVFRGGETSAVITSDDPDRWWATLAPQTFESSGVDPAQWNFDRAVRARYIRAWFRCADSVQKLIIHRVEFGVRPATHQR